MSVSSAPRSAASFSAASLRGVSRGERTRRCHEQLEAARAEGVRRHAAGESGTATARAWSDAVDAVVRVLFEMAVEEHGLSLALVAVGGYGRSELCPASDLDLWFITAPTGSRACAPRGEGSARGECDARVAALAEEVLYPLWDLKLQVGHAVRTVADTMELGAEDLTVATALLDLRLVAGEAGLYAELAAAARGALADGPAVTLVRRLVEEKARRHARFGDTLYLLEPDMKNGQGAYRDLLVALWAAKARFQVGDFSDLLALGQATERQVAELQAARNFFLRLRTAAHLYARRRQDRLNFEVQEAIAPALLAAQGERPDHPSGPGAGPGPLPSAPAEMLGESVRPGVAPAVEALMRAYYLHAKAVMREGHRLLERCAEEGGRRAAARPSIRSIDASFLLWNGQLSTAGPEVFRERPAEMVRLFRVALERRVRIYGHTRDLIADACARPETAAELAADPAAAEHFLALLVDERDARSPSLLEEMHDLGLLAALMPEFAPCTARVQHDIYHVFTVDQHSLYAVGRLKALARGELERELPTATQAMREVERKVPLYLGTLLHDVGKPLGKGHAEKGARLGRIIGARLRLAAADLGLVELLIARHLVLSHLSQRRDLSDMALIARLASDLGDEETLRALYLLTVADMSMVAPGNLTAWKEQLLRELYQRTLTYLRRGADLAETGLPDTVAATMAATLGRRKRQAAALLRGELYRRSHVSIGPDASVARGERRPEGLSGSMRVSGALDDLELWFAGLPERYFAQTPPVLIASHVRLSRGRAPGGVALAATHHPHKGWSELSVVTDDAPGLLARLAGVLLAGRIDVMNAQIACRRTSGASGAGSGAGPGEGAEAIDVFHVRDRYGRALTDERVEALREDLARVLAGEVEVSRLIEGRRERTTLRPRVKPHVTTEVKIDNEVSAEYTVVDVYTQDRPGVLYAITRTLSTLGMDIDLAKVATEADRVADVFYVRDRAGRKLTGAEAQSLGAALAQALAALE
jgi:[protein-PII] uridylyltransferase